MVTRGQLSRRRFLVNAAGAAALATSTAVVMSSPAGARSTDRLVVNTNGSRLRSGPGTGYRILASLAKGTQVRYLAWGGRANGYDWAKVQVVATGATGFIAFQLLSPLHPGGGTGRPKVEVAAGPLRVRSAPGLGSSVIRTAPTGARGEVTTEMPVTKDGYVWVNVRFYDYGTGWVAKNFLTWL